jgi:hypothetical protein
MPITGGSDRTDVLYESATIQVPYGMQLVDILVVGAGGSGATGATPGGGGAGGVVTKQFDVQPGDWGMDLVVVVGTGAVDADGGDTTVDGALNGATFAQLKAGGGSKAGAGGGGGAGGVAEGGDVNVVGQDGVEYDTENDLPGAGGTTGYFTYGDGGSGSVDTQIEGNPGFVRLEWKN